MAGSTKFLANPIARGAIAVVVLVLLVVRFPLFHVARTNPSVTAIRGQSGTAAFDAVAAAAQLWATELRAAAQRATRLESFVGELRADPLRARSVHGVSSAGMGAAYYFVSGSGTVVAQDRNYIRLELDGAAHAKVQIRIGPVFGNTVRDGCGLLDVNSFPGLQEFNALAAELNTLVEKNVLPGLREKGLVGSHVTFVGCAEAPESIAGPEEPILTLVPVQAEVR